jgi:hypothetical protein
MAQQWITLDINDQVALDAVLFTADSDSDIRGVVLKNINAENVYIWPNSLGTGLNISKEKP